MCKQSGLHCFRALSGLMLWWMLSELIFVLAKPAEMSGH